MAKEKFEFLSGQLQQFSADQPSMRFHDLKKTHPAVHRAISDMLLDSGVDPPNVPIPNHEIRHLDLAQKQLSKMKKHEIETLSSGEQGEADAIVKKHGASHAHKLLGRVFQHPAWSKMWGPH